MPHALWVFATFCLICGCASSTPSPPPPPTAPAATTLIFRGTVEAIQPAPLERSRDNWVVTFRIDRVIQGDFTGQTFSFRIHSPARSGLETARQYIVEARPVPGGFEVDQYQWLRPGAPDG